MIDACIDIEFGKPLVRVLRPTLAPFLQQVGAVPVAVLLAEPVLVDVAQGEHDMGVRLGLAIGSDVPMHVEVGDHPAVDELPFNELARQPNTFGLVQFARERELHLTR